MMPIFVPVVITARIMEKMGDMAFHVRKVKGKLELMANKYFPLGGDNDND